MRELKQVISPDVSDDIDVAQKVIDIEIEGLKALKASLNTEFSKISDLFLHLKGRVIVSGMGKSGHIARKIASTLSSTGTASYYVHPAEASHGDLGMIEQNDAVLAISNSGESAELSDLIHYCKRCGIPLVALTKNPLSSLGKAADYVLTIPNCQEACPMGLAPTTSTTVTLAMGDAIAVNLLEKRGFSADKFHTLHPGGQLGKKLLLVEQIMHKEEALPLIEENTPVSEALITMTNKSFGCVGVVDTTGELTGIITDGDLRRHMSSNLLNLKAKDIMTNEAKVIQSSVLVSEALRIMNSSKITSLFVVGETKKPLGIIHVHDCLRVGPF